MNFCFKGITEYLLYCIHLSFGLAHVVLLYATFLCLLNDGSEFLSLAWFEQKIDLEKQKLFLKLRSGGFQQALCIKIAYVY